MLASGPLGWLETELLAAGEDLLIPLPGGGADVDYEWEAFVDYNAANVSVTAELDGSSADMESVVYGMFVADIAVGTGVVFSGAGIGSQTGEVMNNVGGTAAATGHCLRGRITQRTGLGVQISCDLYETDGAARNVGTRQVRRTTTGAITSFGIHADNATGMAAGSWLRVRPIIPQNA